MTMTRPAAQPATPTARYMPAVRKLAARLMLLLLVPGAGLLALHTHAQQAAQVAQADVAAFEQLPELDSDYQALFDRYLSKQSKSGPAFNEFTALVQAVRQAPDAITGSAILRNNLSLLLDNIASADFQELLGYLYRANDTATVKAITDHINKVADTVAASQNYFLLAQYYYERGNWEGVRAALSKVDFKDLAEGDRHYYDVLMGYALQALKDHRKAVRFYKNIPPMSPYYAHAKLNQGTAFLRQGWWSEAHMELEQAIEAAEAFGDEAFRDRLLVVMAYSQLNYEFYRDARTTLRRVSLNGPYTNKAIMGLGLAAAYQEDFGGAINAFELLRQKTPADLSVDEAHLLSAYAIVETGDKPRAELAYQTAINHFQRKIDMLEQLQRQLEQSSIDLVSSVVGELNARADEIYGNDALIPEYFLANYRSLADMQQRAASSEVEKDIRSLRVQYEQQLKGLVSTNINLRKTMLGSYLSQAKYGKAKLYDK